MRIRYEIHDERFRQLVDTDEDLKTITTGFRFLEGPVWHPYDHVLIFSDILGNCLYQWSADQGIATFREHSYMANGNTLDRQAREAVISKTIGVTRCIMVTLRIRPRESRVQTVRARHRPPACPSGGPPVYRIPHRLHPLLPSLT